MNRDFLKELGIEGDAIDKIMTENGKDIEKAKGDASKAEELKTENASLKSTIAERDQQLEDLKKTAGDNEQLKSQIDKLKDDNKTAAEKHDKEMADLRKGYAIDNALLVAKAKAVKAAKAYIDTEKVTIDSKGNVTGIDDQIKALKEANDTKFLFDDGAPSIKGAAPGEPSDPEHGYTKAQILAMPYPKQQEIYNQDPEAYKAIMGQ